MGAQLEPEVDAVEEQEDDGGSAGEEEDRGILVALAGVVEDTVELVGWGSVIDPLSHKRGTWDKYRGREDQRGRRQRHEGAASLGRGAPEALLARDAVGVAHVVYASQEEAHAHDEEEVGEDRPQHGRLDDLDLAIAQSDDADLRPAALALTPFRRGRTTRTRNQLDGIAEGGIEKAAKSLAHFVRDLLGSKG